MNSTHIQPPELRHLSFKQKLILLLKNLSALLLLGSVITPVLFTVFLYVQLGVSGQILSGIRHVLHGV